MFCFFDQELTTRLDTVLLEKAEAQQSTLSLRKANENCKEELKVVISHLLCP